MASNDVVSQTFRALVETADRKFARARDLPPFGRAQTHCFQKVFKAYMRPWKYQQENRSKLVEAGLNRWEIGEIASRIGQLYFNQYMRTSESRFLVEAYVFYGAILSRRYFEVSKVKDPGVRFKELRFYARFLLVSLILNRSEMVKLLVEKFRALVDDSRTTFRETNFREWKLVVQEIVRFMNVDISFTSSKPLRYCATVDSHPASIPYVARFHSKKILKFHDALLTSYHRNEVKFAELTLDTYRMLQCLEWEPSGSFYQKRPIEAKENGAIIDHSGTSGVIDMNLAADSTDPFLPPNPRKAILYRPSATQILAVMATICEELPPESVMLIYLSAPGKASVDTDSWMESSVVSSKTSKDKVVSRISLEKCSISESHTNGKGDTNEYYGSYLCFGPKGNGWSNNLYPGDIIPFTRKPIFLIIDSDDSHAFKLHVTCGDGQVLHGAEMEERAAIILSPLKPAFKIPPSSGVVHNGSQFTFFLTDPLRAFCQMVGLTPSNTDLDVYNNAESILSAAFSAWEVILCTLTNLDLVWAQVLSDPFLRRIILRFIFCRSVLYIFCPPEERELYLPVCLPHLPFSVSPSSDVVRSTVISLSNHLNVVDCFRFDDT